MRRSPNASLWRDYGVFSPEAQAICDEMMPAMLWIGKTHPEALRVVAAAATFQLLELPKRTKEVRVALRWKPRMRTKPGGKP